MVSDIGFSVACYKGDRTGWNPLWKLDEGIKQMAKEIKS